jgi:nicotinamide riboside kinase
MVIAIAGENCSGKSSLAEAIKKEIDAEIITGKDYLRMAKSENEAAALFRKKLENAISGGHLIYVTSETEQLEFLPEGAVRILVYADIDTIKARFKARLHGNLPAPVAQMLEKKHGIFDNGTYDYRFDGVNGDPSSLCAELRGRCGVDGVHGDAAMNDSLG